MKKMILAAAMLLAAINLTIAQNPNPGPGETAGDRIAERVESAATSSSDQKALVKEIAEAARKAGKDNPNDADKVKEIVRKKLDEIRDRPSSNGKPGGKNNKEIEEWVKKLKSDLMDKGYVALPNLGNTSLACSAKGTGRTTGHIADLSLNNPTNTPITAEIGPLFIPSDGQYQPYIVPDVVTITVPAHATANVPVEGFCSDIFSPPVPPGEAMPPATDWVFVSDPLPSGWAPLPAKGWKPAPGITALIPGTGMPLRYTIDPKKYPAEAAAVLLEALTHIADAWDHMKSDGAVTTPFSGNPEKEREAVIQQTFWLYASALTGKEYKLNDFSQNTIRQFEAGTGQKFSAAKQETKDEINKGVAAFWDTFQAVGTEAKVLAAPQQPAGHK